MRAVLLESIDPDILEMGSTVKIDKIDDVHHLTSVVRIKREEKILVLNKRGSYIFSTVKNIGKKSIEIVIEKVEFVEKKFPQIEVAVGLTKKESYEFMLKQSVEMGISCFHPILTDYSQKNIAINEQRVTKIIDNAVIQSNHPYDLAVFPPVKFSDFKWDEYSAIFCFSVAEKKVEKFKKRELGKEDKILLAIGPEGGFSSEEMSSFEKMANINIYSLPTNILRTETALSVGVGFFLGKVL